MIDDVFSDLTIDDRIIGANDRAIDPMIEIIAAMNKSLKR
jgi:hypothetical protein